MDRSYIIPVGGLNTKFFRKPSDDTETQYAWSQGFSSIYTDSEFPEAGDPIYYAGQVADDVDEFAFSSSAYIITSLNADNKYYREEDEDDSVNGYYAWMFNSSTLAYTASATPSASDTIYTKSGGTYTSAGTVSSVLLGPTASTETIGGYTITYYTAQDGHKIVLADQETTASNIYTAVGIAWYYIFDIANIRFKLPRTKFGFTGLRDTVGKYVVPGLPNITGKTGDRALSSGDVDGAFYTESGTVGEYNGTTTSNSVTKFDASRSSSIYGNSTTVQPPATQMYLYFNVGKPTQTATEQTAGLNAELFNDKADIDLQNIDSTGKDYVANLAMPSGTYDTVTPLASGQTYTAPANGYYRINWYPLNTGCWASVSKNGDELVLNRSYGNSASWYERFLVPVSKGDVITITYDANLTSIRFYYANGDV